VKGWVEDISKALIRAKKAVSKPFAVVFLAAQSGEVFETILRIQRKCMEEGIACFSSMDAAIKAINKSITYYQNRDD
jgi:hypothetical protein